MILPRFRIVCLTALLGSLSPLASAQTSVSLNLDYAEGRYGEPDRSVTWTTPLIIKHQAGAYGLKLYLPYVRATGTAAAGGDRFAATRQVQEGFGDPVITLTRDLIGDRDADLTVDIGVKAKVATADRRLDLITTGENDYSLQADFLHHLGKTSVFATLGRTLKGDPPGIDYRDPWYYTVGASRTLADGFSAGLLYDHRQRVTAAGAPVSEATLYLEIASSPRYKWQAYVVRGFADASPDLGAGATVTLRF